MDMPIYLQFLDNDSNDDRLQETEPYFPRYKWYVIEEQTTANYDSEELEKHRWIHNIGHDRVRHLHLPKLDFNVLDEDVVFLVSGSRIFLIGGVTDRQSYWQPNGILSIDVRANNLSWKRCDFWAAELAWPVGSAVFRDTKQGTDLIYVSMTDKEICFNCGYFESGQVVVDSLPAFQKTSRVYSSLLCSFDLKLISYKFPFVSEYPTPTSKCNVVVEQFMICFLPWSPDEEKSWEYCPALYVYDTSVGEWLSQPVQGLPNDGIVLPLLLEDSTFKWAMENQSLMQVRTDTLKLALVWEIGVGDAYDEIEVHWTKFTLNKEKLRAENLSSGTFNGGNAHLINSAAG